MSIFQQITPNPGRISQDASNRTRVSQSTTLHDGKLIGQDNPLMWDTKGTGTGAFTNNKYSLSVTSGQYLIRQTKRFAPYSSGKSQQIECTFDGFGADANVTKRIGYFSSIATGVYDSAYDGFWLENDGSTITLKAARAGTETLSVAITSWSGYASLGEYQSVSNWGNFTVVQFDFLWLGGAVLRMFVKTQTGFVLAHIFHYSGTATDTFIKSPNQPTRYEIRSSTGSGSMRYVCSQVSTEGSIDECGYNNANHSLLTAAVPSQTMATIGTKYALCGIRKAAAYRDGSVKVTECDVSIQSANDFVHYELLLNPTLSAGLTYSAMTNSFVEFGLAGAIAAITITATGGRILHGGFLSQGQTVPGGVLERDFLSYLGCTIDNVMDEIVLVIMPITAAVTVNGSICWKEY